MAKPRVLSPWVDQPCKPHLLDSAQPLNRTRIDEFSDRSVLPSELYEPMHWVAKHAVLHKGFLPRRDEEPDMQCSNRARFANVLRHGMRNGKSHRKATGWRVSRPLRLARLRIVHGTVIALALGIAPATSQAEPPRTHEILVEKPSGFWTSNRPASGGAYRYRLLGLGAVIALITGVLTLRLVKRTSAKRPKVSDGVPRTRTDSYSD